MCCLATIGMPGCSEPSIRPVVQQQWWNCLVYLAVWSRKVNAIRSLVENIMYSVYSCMKLFPVFSVMVRARYLWPEVYTILIREQDSSPKNHICYVVENKFTVYIHVWNFSPCVRCHGKGEVSMARGIYHTYGAFSEILRLRLRNLNWYKT